MKNNGTRGYSGYRGRRQGAPKRLIAVLALLVLLAASAFLFAQRYKVYRTDGSFRYELPWRRGERTGESGDGQELEIVIENPDGTETTIKGG